jgi:hypothetical protein
MAAWRKIPGGIPTNIDKYAFLWGFEFGFRHFPTETIEANTGITVVHPTPRTP